MPKIAPTKYPILKLAIGNSRYSQKEIAQKIGMNEQSFCYKIQGKRPFTLDEAIAIQKNFFPNEDLEYLFTKKRLSKVVTHFAQLVKLFSFSDRFFRLC